MTELRFHREVYLGEAVDAASKVYEKFAKLTLREDGEHWVVDIVGKNAARERRVAGELANYALGLTIRDRGGE